ncbi:hypothetical protein [Actibacterium sp. 188UL27-1]|uniref:hypothetical protein n=1 Tax=Actibacterium sp. 188UL27-1 TaxID=2786961 RepID=UPI00195C3B25|nr:hypothetical protein [Actibacterium sp. 188UL27-1]MBM7069828.1 hypothetical protein [Actibacterium sp. 188UL27-1]
MAQKPSALLITGTSHVGKTTLARDMGRALGWAAISTDTLGRHPGRPWPTVRVPVAEYYASLSPETIQWFLKVHYQNMRPRLEQVIETRLADGARFVLEGSALRPEMIARYLGEGVMGVCLHASAVLLRRRIHGASGYDDLGPDHRVLVDAFLERSLRDSVDLMAEAQRCGLHCINVGESDALKDFRQELYDSAVMGSGPR